MIYVYIRNSVEYNWIKCGIGIYGYNNIKLFGMDTLENVCARLISEKKEITYDFIKFALKYHIKHIAISIKGPIKLDYILDTELLKANGINVVKIHDTTIKNNNAEIIRNSLERVRKRDHLY